MTHPSADAAILKTPNIFSYSVVFTAFNDLKCLIPSHSCVMLLSMYSYLVIVRSPSKRTAKFSYLCINSSKIPIVFDLKTSVLTPNLKSNHQ